MPVSERAGRRFCYGTALCASSLRKENLLAPWESWGKGFVKADDFLAVMVEDLAKK